MRIQKNKALLATLLIVLAGAGLWYALKPAPTKLATPTTIPVRVIAVSEKDVPRYTSGIGSVLSLHSVVVRPQIDGILTKILVKEGQLVKAGDLLATIDDRMTQAGVSQAQAQVAQAPCQGAGFGMMVRGQVG